MHVDNLGQILRHYRNYKVHGMHNQHRKYKVDLTKIECDYSHHKMPMTFQTQQ